MRGAGDARSGFLRARSAVTAAFATHAILSGSLGPWIPRLKSQAELDPAGLGVALTGYAAGLLLGTRVAGWALRRVGGRPLVRAGIPALAVGFALLALPRGLGSMTTVFVGIGLAAGLVDVAMNTEAVAVEQGFGRTVLSMMHGTWSVSVFAGAAVASAAVAAGIPITVSLAASSAILAATSFPLLRWLPTEPEDGPPASTAGRADHPLPPAGRVALLCLVAAAAFLTEGIAIEWSALYLRGSIGVAVGLAGLGVVAFSAGMAVARFAGDRLAARLGGIAMVRAGLAVAAVALGAALLVDRFLTSILALAVMGLGLGPVVPFVFRAAAAAAGARRDGTALPIVVTAGYAGSIVGPLIVGFVADSLGLRAALTLPVLACGVAAFAATAMQDR
ncbi:MAG TPA: MFS transporter [Actinomycetota bacterium]|nr:MFS transporter [Actinomycetota bacterium]